MAVVDMGSNSWRIVVFDYEPGTTWWTMSDEIRESVRIGAGIGEDGALDADAIDRGIHTAAVFDGFCRASHITDVETVATSAIRDAPNRERLLGPIRERTSHIRPQLIDGEREGRLGYLAICNSSTIADGFGLDIGGGSIQAMRIEGRRLTAVESLRLGSVRVSERFLPDEEPSKKQLAKLRKHAARELGELGWWQGGGRLVGIGGTIRNLAAAVMKRRDVPHVDGQGFELELGELEELIAELISLPASRRGEVGGIKPDRGDVILGGALVLETALREGGFDAVEITEAGIREGLFSERLLADTEPPLFDDVRAASVANLAHRYSVDGAHTEHVAKLSGQMFDGLKRLGVHELADPERELLIAACALHDIGVTVGYDDHHHHSRYLIQSAGLPGWTPREVILVSLIARYHRKGSPSASELGDLAIDGDSRRLAILSGIIRLAEQFERSRDGSIDAIEVRSDAASTDDGADGTPLVLEVSAAGDDSEVALWSARRNVQLLADSLGRPLEVRERAGG